nr:adenosylcobinamide-phosphate synthase CbiB [uncultured Blautia sp.]
MMKWTALALVLGFFIDLLVGDPRWLYHPVRIIGHGISFLEKHLRTCFPKTEKGEQRAGFLLVLLVCAGSAAVPFGILYLAYRIHLVFGICLEILMCYQMLAVKSLKDESMRVFEELKKGDLEGARYAVSMIVGRDTRTLDEAGVTKAAVETVAENTSDGIIAPLFYMAIGGPVLMFFYKGVNTMDSMVGYKNEKYLNFGRYAAKFDDIMNYIPARISAWLMIAASYMCGFDGKNAAKIYIRDRYNHASPNSAQTEAVMAGALDIQLAGNAYYFGKLYEKPTIGDNIRPVESQDIQRANRLLYVSAAVAAGLFAGIRLLVQGLVMLL